MADSEREIIYVAWLREHTHTVWSPSYRVSLPRRRVATPHERAVYEEVVKEAGSKDPVRIRYSAINAINNISLSVHPRLKRAWGINIELFGNPWNTAGRYCTLFPDIEKPFGADCNAYTFQPASGDIILANPPYTVEHIEAVSRRILYWVARIPKLVIIVILPVWDTASRAKAKLPANNYGDLPAITRLLNSRYCQQAEIVKIPFWDAFHNRPVDLRDPVHAILITNTPTILSHFPF
jgi:hypothetical protein